MKFRPDHLQHIAAAKAGFSERTARRIEAHRHLTPSPDVVRTRQGPDPFDGLWDSEIRPLLETHPGLRPVAVLEEMQRHHPDHDWDRLRRSLERRVRAWRAQHGADREVIFRQDHVPGQQALSDFTDMADAGVSIAGQTLDHRLYHFVLAYSAWEHAEPVLGGESFSALAVGLQNALWSLGGVPVEHRSDSLSAAFRNLDDDARVDQTRRYEALCDHYGMTPTRNNTGVAHENGAIESQHGHLKRTVIQALLLRGSVDFESLEAYRGWIANLIGRRNARRAKMVQLECAALRPLPAGRTTDYDEATVFVTTATSFTACAANQWRCSTWSIVTCCSHVRPIGWPGRSCWRTVTREEPANRWCRFWRWRTIAAAKPSSPRRSPSRWLVWERRASASSMFRRCRHGSHRCRQRCLTSPSIFQRSPVTMCFSRRWASQHERQRQRHNQSRHRAAAIAAA
jgi:hypothetical protein